MKTSDSPERSEVTVAKIERCCLFTEEGFAAMERGLPLVAEVLKRARKHHVKVVLGTDGVAGAHGRNAEEFIYRVKDGGDRPMEALTSGMSVAAESLGIAGQIGSIAEGMQADLVGGSVALFGFPSFTTLSPSSSHRI